jgi:hypothetical protein
MPIAGIPGGESPSDIRKRQSRLDVAVLEDVVVIVIIGEGMSVDRIVKSYGRRCQNQAENSGMFD